ncbi:MAG TPA: DinB family protein [Acidimicrobiales bacterium]|nr:DinB family protein [Acidimicrobiales bacterium]
MPDIVDSLHRRLGAMHSLYHDACTSMTIDQVNHFEREGVLPIAFSLFHFINMEDATFMAISGIPPIWNEEWEARVQPAISDHGKERTVDEMVAQRIGDYDAFQAYMAEVFGRTEAWVAEQEADSLDRVIVGRPFPDQVANTYSARVAGEVGITALDALECWIYQHGLRHMGEIEHARALVGLGGMTS